MKDSTAESGVSNFLEVHGAACKLAATGSLPVRRVTASSTALPGTDLGSPRSFHGKDPSKNKKDKRFRKIAEEQERKRRTMSAIGDDHALSRLAAVQEQSARPYLVSTIPAHPLLQRHASFHALGAHVCTRKCAARLTRYAIRPTPPLPQLHSAPCSSCAWKSRAVHEQGVPVLVRAIPTASHPASDRATEGAQSCSFSLVCSQPCSTG